MVDLERNEIEYDKCDCGKNKQTKYKQCWDCKSKMPTNQAKVQPPLVISNEPAVECVICGGAYAIKDGNKGCCSKECARTKYLTECIMAR